MAICCLGWALDDPKEKKANSAIPQPCVEDLPDAGQCPSGQYFCKQHPPTQVTVHFQQCKGQQCASLKAHAHCTRGHQCKHHACTGDHQGEHHACAKDHPSRHHAWQAKGHQCQN